MFSWAWDSKCEPSGTYSYSVSKLGFNQSLVVCSDVVVHPVAQISIYKPMLGFKKLLKLGFCTDSCCKPSNKSFVRPSWDL